MVFRKLEIKLSFLNYRNFFIKKGVEENIKVMQNCLNLSPLWSATSRACHSCHYRCWYERVAWTKTQRAISDSGLWTPQYLRMDSATRIAYRFSTSMASSLEQLIRAARCPQKALITLHWERPHLSGGILALRLKISWWKTKAPFTALESVLRK